MTPFLLVFGVGLVALLYFNKKLRDRVMGLLRREAPVQTSYVMPEMPLNIQQPESLEEMSNSFWWRGREFRKNQFNEWPQYFYFYHSNPDYYDMMVEIHKDKPFWDLMKNQEQLHRSEKFYMARWMTFKKDQDES